MATPKPYVLHSYWRSTTSYRARIVLNLKGLDYQVRSVDLVAGDQRSAAFRALNASSGVPVLELPSGERLSQSLAIADYVDNLRPEPPLLPADPLVRAKALEAAQIVALDIHPINNLKVVNTLKTDFGADAQAAKSWMQNWMVEGFSALEAKLPTVQPFPFSDGPGLFEACLVAQLYNAHRWNVDLSPFPKIRAVEQACLGLPAFAGAHPDRQPDAPQA